MSNGSQLEKLKWVSVLKAMPDTDLLVLIYAPKDPVVVWIGYFDSAEDCWRYDNQTRITNPVTHWAEMPEGPK